MIRTKWIPWKKRCVDAEIHQIILGERTRILYHVILKLILQEIMYFYGEICGIRVNVPRFLKNAFHIPEECYLGTASLVST